MDVTQQFQSWYSGTPKEKLEQARALLAVVQRNQCIDAGLQAELAALRKSCEQLNQQMEQMEMGALCTACAKRPNGGCCSAYMADNTDSIQILINLLLEKDIDQRLPEDNECCFLGPRGCLFMAKPIFCLNYNCTHIVQGAAPPGSEAT